MHEGADALDKRGTLYWASGVGQHLHFPRTITNCFPFASNSGRPFLRGAD